MAHFPGSSIVIATNDNEDDSDAVLSEWASSDSNRTVLSFDGIADALPGRINRLASLRNFCLDHIRRSGARDAEYLMVVDLDGPNRDLDPQAIAGALSNWPADAGGVFANQVEAYYDIYALRHPAWCPGDCWSEISAAAGPWKGWLRLPFSGRRYGRAVSRHLWARQFRIPPDTSPIAVDSAFGGLGIYRMDTVERCWYGAYSEAGQQVCEHVVFHTQVRASGARLYIMPSLLNHAPVEHLGGASGRPPPQFLTQGATPSSPGSRS
jgi:hypothetical protein